MRSKINKKRVHVIIAQIRHSLLTVVRRHASQPGRPVGTGLVNGTTGRSARRDNGSDFDFMIPGAVEHPLDLTVRVHNDRLHLPLGFT